MEIRKYINISENDEKKVNDFLKKYPPLDEWELLEEVRKELPSTNIVRTFCSIISTKWQSLVKTNLICWDITVHFEERGYVGARVDKYLLGLILNHLYTTYASAKEIRDLLDNIEQYLDKKGQRTFGAIIETIKRTKFVQNKPIPYQALQKKASTETEEIENLLARLERLKKYDSNAMENL